MSGSSFGGPVTGIRARMSHDGDETAGPAQYGTINAVYALLFAGVLAATRGRDADAERIQPGELVPLTAATFAISKVIAREKVGAWVREPFVDDPVGRKRPTGGRFQRAIGELVTCSRCVGAWTALGLVGLRLARPRTGRTVTTVFAVAGLNDYMQAGFRGLCDWANGQRR